MGDLAAKTLSRRIREGETNTEEVFVNPELVIRESSASG